MGFTLIQQVWDPIGRRYVEDELTLLEAMPSWLSEPFRALQEAFPGSEWVLDLDDEPECDKIPA